VPTVAQLQALAIAGTEPMDVGHVLLIDGVRTALCDRRGLVGISTGAGHNVVLGLSREGLSRRLAIDLRTGQMLDSPLRATLRDFTGTLDLAALFRAIDDTERALDDVPVGSGLPIGPSSDLSTRTDLHSKNIGLERIGSAGERHQYPVPPSFTIGMQHRLRSGQLHLAAAPVSDEPIVWNGRRIELYRVWRDHITYPDDDTLGWAAFDEWVIRWWGTMRDDGDVAGHEFEIECDGPESLLRKPLGVGFQRDPVQAIGQFELSAEESAIAIHLSVPGGGAGFVEFGTANYTYTITGDTPETILADVQAAIDDIAGTIGGTDGVFNDQPGCSVSMDDQGVVRIAVVINSIGPAELEVGLHDKVWALLGYVPDLQTALLPNYDDTRAVAFVDASTVHAFAALQDPPSEGYRICTFTTGNLFNPAPVTDDDPEGVTNGGVPRVYRPWYLSGTQVLFADPTQGGTRSGQEVRLGDAALGVDTSQSTVAHPGQLDRPPASAIENVQAAYTLNGAPVNRQGLWLFYGKRRLTGQEEVVDEYQVARASWVNASGQQDGLVAGDTILVTEWLEPGLFGFNRPKLGTASQSENDLQWGGDWVARVDAISPDEGVVFAVPIVGLGYLDGSTDRADVVLQRLLYSAGTSTGWSSFASDAAAELDPGGNEPTVGHDLAVLDGETAELGLAIPRDRVQSVASFNAAVDRVEQAAILEAKVAFSGGYQALDVIRALMQLVGWCWNLRGGQYGIFCPADSATLEDAEFVLDRSVKVKKFADATRMDTRQQLRRAAPIDRWTFETSWAPHFNATQQRIELLSPDPGYTYRPGDVPITVPAHSYRPSQGSGGLVDRVAYVSAFWARRHFEVRGYRVSLAFGENIWPGSIGRITDPVLVDPRGETGVTNRLCIVTAHTEVLDVDDGYVLLDLLVLGDRSITPRLHAPVAVGTSYDSTLLRAYVLDNYFAIESDGTWSDAGHFSEPTYDGITAFGGNALVAAVQWDGDTWSQNATATCTGVVTTSGASYLQLSGVSGTIYRDMDTLWVLQPRDEAENAAWVEALFAPICDDDGTYTDDAAAAQPGYPWEA
jgi:hypothetical protein